MACPPDGGCDPLERAPRRDNRRRRGPVDGRRRRSRKEGGPAVRAPPSACLGVAGPARVAHRRRRRRPDTIGAAADRYPVRLRSEHDRPPALPPLRSNRPPAQANRRKVAVPRLHREVPRPTLRPVRGGPRGRHPRPAGPTAVRALPDHRSRQPRNLRRMRAASTGTGSNTRRTALRQVRTSPRPDLRGLRTHRTRCYLEGDRQAVVLGVQAEVDPRTDGKATVAHRSTHIRWISGVIRLYRIVLEDRQIGGGPPGSIRHGLKRCPRTDPRARRSG